MQCIIYVLYFTRFVGIALEFVGFFYAIILLPDSIEFVLERRKATRTFHTIHKTNRKNPITSLIVGFGLSEALLDDSSRGNQIYLP